MSQVGGLSDAMARSAVQHLYAARLSANVDVVRGLLIGPDISIHLSNVDTFESVLSRGSGAILWVSDFASAGDVTKLALARRGYKLKHLSRPEHGFSETRVGMRLLNPIRIGFETRYLEERVVFNRDHPAPALMKLAKHLRANGVVSIGASSHEGRTLIEAQFLSGSLRLAGGAIQLSLMTGSPIIPVHVIGRAAEPGLFDVIFDEPLSAETASSRRDSMIEMGRRYVERLEYYVVKHPEAWVGWRRKDQLAAAGHIPEVSG